MKIPERKKGAENEKFRSEVRSEFRRLTSGLSAHLTSGQNTSSAVAASPTNHGNADEIERRSRKTRKRRTELRRKNSEEKREAKLR
jgi:hypothetical protein